MFPPIPSYSKELPTHCTLARDIDMLGVGALGDNTWTTRTPLAPDLLYALTPGFRAGVLYVCVLCAVFCGDVSTTLCRRNYLRSPLDSTKRFLPSSVLRGLWLLAPRCLGFGETL
ncbi:unnamed protein product [Ixodes pacificus]